MNGQCIDMRGLPAKVLQQAVRQAMGRLHTGLSRQP